LSYADAFVRLEKAAYIDNDLAQRLIRASGFRNRVAHMDEALDLKIIYDLAQTGPQDLLTFLDKAQELLPR
jgi:uncharacterized protein YutE (UPF0331/DUF86 family)